jgi:hypothetical protein
VPPLDVAHRPRGRFDLELDEKCGVLVQLADSENAGKSFYPWLRV